MRSTLTGIFALTAGLLLALPVFGQTVGDITGVVTDASGGVIVGATVTVTNPQTNFTRAATTNTSGIYNFPALQPGVYNVRAELQGFQSEIRNGVELQVQQTARIDFQLRVGGVAETIEVTGGAPLLNTENASLGTVVDGQRIVDLPLNGRNFLSLVSESPNVSAGFNTNGGTSTGAASTRLGGDRANQSFAVSGSRREFNNYSIDGVVNTEPNFNAYLFLPSIDAIQEFKVQTGIYSAEFGRGIGQVNVSTKSGTNQYHGTLFEFLRNSALDARPFGFTTVVPQKSPFKQNQYGFTLGGPLSIPKVFNGKDRLFFMSNFEGFRSRQQIQQVYTTAPAIFRTGDFSSLLPNTIIRDPANRDANGNKLPFTGNIIPQSKLSSIPQALLQYYPLPNVPSAGNSNNFLNLQNNASDKDEFTQRVDFVESSKSTWFGRYSFDTDHVVIPALYLNGNILDVTARQAVISNTRILSPNIVNEARFGVNYFHNVNAFDTSNKPQYDLMTQLGLQLGTNWTSFENGIPGIIGLTGYSSFGSNTEGPYQFRDANFDWNDSIAWTHGKHSMKFGGSIVRVRFNTLGNAFPRGQFSIGNNATGYSFADYMAGYIGTSWKAASENIAQERATNQAYFVTDTWKVRPGLTIDAGFRYELMPPYSYKNDTASNWQVPFYAYTPADAVGHPHPVLVRVGSGDVYGGNIPVRFDPAIPVVRDGRLGPNLIQTDYHDFAPRLGIAYSPRANWTIRVGGGIFYAQEGGAPSYYDNTRNFAGRLNPSASATLNNITWADPYLLKNGNPCGTTPPLVCATLPGPTLVTYDRRTPYMAQWTGNVEHQIGKSTVVEIGYVGSVSHFLQRFHNINNPIPGPGSTASRTPWPELGAMQFVDSDVNARYYAGTAKVTRRLSGGLTFLAGYTYGKSLDDGSGIRAVTNDNGEQNDACINPCERGRSSFDQAQRFVASVLYDLPVGKGRHFMNHGGIANTVIGGWRLSSIVTKGSGFPTGIGTGTNRSNAGGDRPDAVPGQSVSPSNPSTGQWFNIQAFALNQLYQWGNVGRNVITGPGVSTWDFSTLKDFPFAERRFVEFRFEAFNFANHANFGDPNASLTSNAVNSVTGVAIPGTGSFGTISSLRSGIDMRELQFSLKVVF
jgi:hypothetical protein